jgi:hypothetical protein
MRLYAMKQNKTMMLQIILASFKNTFIFAARFRNGRFIKSNKRFYKFFMNHSRFPL